jgi:hypothetical protein
MNILPFEWSESTSLATELARPLKQVSVESEPHGWPMFVTLWRSDGTGLRVRSEMHDVAERREIGVLCFSLVLAPGANATLIDVAPSFDRELTVYKLLIEESGRSAESGVVLIGDDDYKMIIVAGVKPYCLALSGLPSAPSKFEPEYPLDRDARVPFHQDSPLETAVQS